MSAVLTDVWNVILNDIEAKVGSEKFSLWFRNVDVGRFDESCLEVLVPNVFARDWLEEKYLSIIRSAVTKHAGISPEIKFRIGGKVYQKAHMEHVEQAANSLGDDEPGMPPGSATLKNFVVGPCNRMAHAAALEVVESPARRYNPLFIHGKVGLGKTHILQGIYNAVQERSGDGGVIYVSGEAFTNQFLGAMRDRNLDAFRHRYRNADYLLIDDVHFLANKAATQEEFLYTFNELASASSQIVIASDSHPTMITRLKETLVSRFIGGVVVALDMPNYKTRVKILKQKAEQTGRKFSDNIIAYIAERFEGSVRELEGAIASLCAYAALSSDKLTLNTVKEALRDHLGRRAVTRTSLKSIEETVCQHFGVKSPDLRSKKRGKSVAFPRHIFIHLARKLTESSFQEIGTFLGGRHHTTALSADQNITQQIAQQPEIATLIDRLSEEIRIGG